MNMGEKIYFTSESVTEGHPDKVADQIADAVLDAYLEKDPGSRVAVEIMVTSNYVLLAGEVTSQAQVDVEQVARQFIKDIGYVHEDLGFDYLGAQIEVRLHAQSPDIALGVDIDQARGKPLGAGDQGIMYGYACDETEELMPLPIMLAHQLARRLAAVRKEETLPYLRPDGKTQVTVEYVDGRPSRVEAMVVSAQHTSEVDMATLRADLTREVIRPAIPASLLDDRCRFFINPTGRFVIGGPHGDTGATGRKAMVDTYGGLARHGGGSFSGKDPTKVDRSASYTLRHAAKSIVAAGLARMGLVPILPLFACFVVRRGLDQLATQVAYPALNVKVCGLYAGLTSPNTGATHQMLQDVAIMRSLPHMTVVEPADAIVKREQNLGRQRRKSEPGCRPCQCCR